MSKTSDARPGRRQAATRGRLSLEVVSTGPHWRGLGEGGAPKLARTVAKALAHAVTLPGRRVAATLVLSDDAHVRALNRQWRGHDKPTNVLSFPSGTPAPAGARTTRLLGDVILARETLVREADGLGIALQDHYRHLVLHGLLHLLGYDHETDEEAEEMETLETRILAALGVADPYADGAPTRADGRKGRRAR